MKEKLIKLIKLVSLGAVVGLVCGLIGAFFHFALDIAAEVFCSVPILLYFLMPAGLLIVLLYKALKVDTKYSTVSVIKAVRNGDEIPKGLSISIFISTFITHIFGGSSGREGAALQLGGCVAGILSSAKKLNLGANLRRGIVMCGMSAVFSALFGTPMSAAVFVLSIINVKQLYKIAAVPCIVSSYIAFFVSKLLGNSGVRYTVSLASFNIDSVWKICLVALLCAFMSIVFCFSIENSKKISSLIKNEYLRIAIGGAAIVGLTLLIGVRDYNGAGSAIIEQAIGGIAKPEAFVLKLLFTCITLSFGYKGGEIVPSFFVGATFGCLVGSFIGLDPSLAAAVGMMSVFCGVTNCPVASIIMSAEVFGMATLPVFVPACIISFAFSGRHSLYGSREIVIEKIVKNLVSAK